MDIDTQYMSCSLGVVESVNYNTKMFTFKLSGASHMIVPTGHHVRVKAKNQQGTYIHELCMYVHAYINIVDKVHR